MNRYTRHRAAVSIPPMLAGLLSLILAVAPMPLAISAEAVSTEIRVESLTHALNKQVLDALCQGAEPDDTGAMGRNRDAFLAVSFQRASLSLVMCGLASDDPSRLDQAVRGIDYGFARQRADGSFETGSFKGRTLDEGDRASSDAFFLSAAGLSHRLLSQSRFRPRYQEALTRWIPQIQRGINNLKSRHGTLRKYDEQAPNRLVFDALAFKINGQVLSDHRAEQIGEEFLASALRLQGKDGAFMEKGGGDSSYQAVTLVLLQYYWLFTQGEPTAPVVKEAIRTGMTWEKMKIMDTGKVSARGNTRTGLGQEQFLGRVKDIDYPRVVEALLLWSHIGTDSEAADLALRVFNYILDRMKTRQGSSASRSSLLEKRRALIESARQPGVPQEKRQKARHFYKDAEAAYKAGNHEEAERLLDQALKALRE